MIDGANRWIGDQAQGILDFRRVEHAVIDNCQVVGSGKYGIAFERVGGRIERSTITGASEAGIYSVGATGLAHYRQHRVRLRERRYPRPSLAERGEDGTMVTGNRVERIAARSGGTGQYGNGINVFSGRQGRGLR